MSPDRVLRVVLYDHMQAFDTRLCSCTSTPDFDTLLAEVVNLSWSVNLTVQELKDSFDLQVAGTAL